MRPKATIWECVNSHTHGKAKQAPEARWRIQIKRLRRILARNQARLFLKVFIYLFIYSTNKAGQRWSLSCACNRKQQDLSLNSWSQHRGLCSSPQQHPNPSTCPQPPPFLSIGIAQWWPCLGVDAWSALYLSYTFRFSRITGCFFPKSVLSSLP